MSINAEADAYDKMGCVLELITETLQRRLTTVYIHGDIGSIALSGSGKSTFYITGNAASIDLDLNGLSQVSSNVTSGWTSAFMLH